MFDKILFATDGSEFAERALPQACQLASDCGATLRCVSSVNAIESAVYPGAASTTGTELYQSLKEGLENQAQGALDRVREDPALEPQEEGTRPPLVLVALVFYGLMFALAWAIAPVNLRNN